MKRLLCDVLHSSLFLPNFRIYIHTRACSFCPAKYKQTYHITWRCHRSVIFPTKEIIDKQEYRVLCTGNIGNAAKHTILLALIYAKYACNRLHLFFKHDYIINSIQHTASENTLTVLNKQPPSSIFSIWASMSRLFKISLI